MFKEQLIIIRHARTETNIRATDDADTKLTKFGMEQRHRLGKFMYKHMDIDAGFRFYTSPFLRCLQTAAAIQDEAPDYHSQFVVTDAVREYINHGHREVKIPVHKDKFAQFNWSRFYYHDELTYKDEFNEEILNRLVGFYHDLPEKSVVVTHGLPALTLLYVASRPGWNSVPIWDHSIDNASITVVVRGRVVWHGRNLYHELDTDPFDKKRAYDASDLLVPKA